MTHHLKKLGATLAVLATICFNPIPAHAQESKQPVSEAVATDITELHAPGERDIYNVDTSDWDFNEPGMNKNNVDNHYLEHILPADLGDPQPEINPGKMRSDRIPLPEGITKEEADKAEVQEAGERGITTPGSQPMMRTLTADNCRTYWPTTHQVCGAIRAKYESMAVTWAGQTPISFLGLPRSGELTNPDGVGKRTQFDNGFIYWHPDTGAWSVTTHNSIVWARNGWEAGRLGYPTSDEIGTRDGVGREQSFQRGRIYGSLAGVASIEGKILEKWIETGEEKGPLGYPATDEEGTPDGVGRFNRFALGMIYWHPNYGAHPITGAISFIWAKEGYEQSRFGYPIGDEELNTNFDISQDFEHGQILPIEYTPETGSIPIGDVTVSKSLINAIRNYIQQDFPLGSSGSSLDSAFQTRAAIDHAQIYPQPNGSYQKIIDGLTYTFEVKTPMPWPSIYIYDPSSERSTLHDFCTSSYQFWGISTYPGAPNDIADLRGPCAIHDICYESSSDKTWRGEHCDILIRKNMKSVCNVAFSNRSSLPFTDHDRIRGCQGYADFAYGVIRSVNGTW